MKAVYSRHAADGVKAAAASGAAPKPRKGEALVRVACAGVNPVDAKHVFGDKLPAALESLAVRAVEGLVPGFDLAGTVVSAPPRSAFSTGARVFGCVPPFRGTLQPLVCVPVDQLCATPAALSDAEAASLGIPGVTAVQALRQHGVGNGSSVLVVGASGGVGHIAVQVARGLGAARVVGVCSAKNAAFVRGLGADAVVPYDAEGESVVDGLQRWVEAEGGKPFDVVLDTVSSHDATDRAFRYEERLREATSPALVASGPGADPHNYVTIGSKTPGWIAAGLKRVFGINCFAAGRELFWIKFPGCAPDLEKLAALAEQGKLRPTLAATLPCTDTGVQQAFRMMRERRTVGKVVVDLAGPVPSDDASDAVVAPA